MIDDSPINSRPIKILIVDDEEIVLSFARDALEDIGYEVRLAGDGMEAQEKIKREFYDFILTDIRMPGCDGLELARIAREINPSIGIIFMTGYANLNTAKNAIKEGAYDYIMKPFELNELRQAVRAAINKKTKDAEKTLSRELKRLFDLNQLMYTVSDRKSLMRLSLGFALMQGSAVNGSIIFKNNNENEIGIFAAGGMTEAGFEERFKKFAKDYFDFNSPEINAPFIINSIDEHPLLREFNEPELALFLTPPWYVPGHRLVNFALKRGPKLYGFLILGYSEDSENLKESNLKLLNITASQIAISLENIILLEESRMAYARLRELQDQTIQLEKIAARGHMSAQIGHELKNYLGVVLGNLDMMKYHLQAKNYSELDRHLNTVLSNLDNMNKFTEGLMDFSGMESRFDECDINNLIRDVIEYLQGQRHFQDINVTFESSQDIIEIPVDTSQLQQLLYNTINNAADAILEKIDAAERLIAISTRFDPERRQLAISIKDNGVGMDKELIEKAFKHRFTTKKSGHGYGLLVCHRIIQNHGGKLQIDSLPGDGTTLTIVLPAGCPVAQPQPL
jgi:signal transduction histidine kinase/CheY-like chemotaxis protein